MCICVCAYFMYKLLKIALRDEITVWRAEVGVPVQVNFLEGVVSRSLSVISPGPVQRAIPGSLYPLFTQSESHCMWQSQYSGFAPKALQETQTHRFYCKYSVRFIGVFKLLELGTNTHITAYKLFKPKILPIAFSDYMYILKKHTHKHMCVYL